MIESVAVQDLKNPSRGRARQLAAVNSILHIFHTHRKQDGESSNRPLACVHSSAGSTIRERAGIPNSVDTNVLLDGAVGRLYEDGTEHRIRFARSELEWLAGLRRTKDSDFKTSLGNREDHGLHQHGFMPYSSKG